MKQPRDRLDWPSIHMLQALVASKRSPDPNTQVGAVIVDSQNRMLSTGYNAFPRGIEQDMLPWDRDGDLLDTKYTYVVHAEANAMKSNLEGATLYVTMFPCNECAKDIIQSGISTVIYLNNPYKEQWQTKASLKLFSLAHIVVKEHIWDSKISVVLSELVDQVESIKVI